MPSISISTSLLLPQVVAKPRIKKYFSDLFTKPTVGLSVRILNKNYDGSLFQIRRTADDVEVIVLADFNDEISLNSLVQNVNEGLGDTLAGNLGEFVGASGFNNPDGLASANDAFVVIWFEQFFSNHASQSTASAQPQIVNAGTVVKENGKPAVYFDGSSDFINHSNSGNWQSVFIVFNYTKSTTVFSDFDGLITSNETSVHIKNDNIGIVASDGNSYLYKTSWYENNIYLNNSPITIGHGGNSVIPEINSISMLSGFSTSAINRNSLQFGKDRASFGRHWEGIISEAIFYPSDQSANRSDIEANINSYYSIY